MSSAAKTFVKSREQREFLEKERQMLQNLNASSPAV